MQFKNKLIRGLFIFVAIVTILGMIAPMGMGLGI
jgi:hypothetical protein